MCAKYNVSCLESAVYKSNSILILCHMYICYSSREANASMADTGLTFLLCLLIYSILYINAIAFLPRAWCKSEILLNPSSCLHWYLVIRYHLLLESIWVNKPLKWKQRNNQHTKPELWFLEKQGLTSWLQNWSREDGTTSAFLQLPGVSGNRHSSQPDGCLATGLPVLHQVLICCQVLFWGQVLLTCWQFASSLATASSSSSDVWCASLRHHHFLTTYSSA